MRQEPCFWGKLDDNIIPLVCALNDLDGIVTVGSCGGHTNPGPTQKEKGHWFVMFKVARDRTRGLARLTRVLEDFGGDVELSVNWDNSGLFRGVASCALSGHGLEPDRIAKALGLDVAAFRQFLERAGL